MNPRRLWEFLRSRFGLFVIFIVAIFAGSWLLGRHALTNRQSSRLALRGARADLGQVSEQLGQGLQSGTPQTPNGSRSKANDGTLVPFDPPAPGNVPARPAAPKAAAPPKKIHYAALLAGYQVPPAAPAAAPAPPQRFIPYGTLLKCKLVNTVDSSDIQTPIIALLLEDVWQDGKLVVPANTLVHGLAHSGRMRDRINASGTWRFVWQDGRELAFNGLALDREYDHDVDGYGITDGSAGLKGQVMAADDLQEVKMLAAAALSGFAQGSQDRIVTGYGVTLPGSLQNGLWQGAGQVFQTYAQRTLTDIEQNGYYVRVAAGKEFYLYVVGTVNPDKARVGGEPAPTASPATGAAQGTTVNH